MDLARDLKDSSLVDWLVFPHNSGLPRFDSGMCVHCTVAHWYLVAHLAVVAATRVRIPASCQLLYIK